MTPLCLPLTTSVWVKVAFTRSSLLSLSTFAVAVLSGIAAPSIVHSTLPGGPPVVRAVRVKVGGSVNRELTAVNAGTEDILKTPKVVNPVYEMKAKFKIVNY